MTGDPPRGTLFWVECLSTLDDTERWEALPDHHNTKESAIADAMVRSNRRSDRQYRVTHGVDRELIWQQPKRNYSFGEGS